MASFSARSACSNFMSLGADGMYTLRRVYRTKVAEEAIKILISEKRLISSSVPVIG